MMINALIKVAILATLLVAIAGCDSNPTNEPAAADIAKANERRAAAIDNDPNMTAADKAKMKEMLHLNGPKGTR